MATHRKPTAAVGAAAPPVRAAYRPGYAAFASAVVDAARSAGSVDNTGSVHSTGATRPYAPPIPER
jgi:hypothetical protein